MTPEQLWFKGWKALDILKSEHHAKTNRAEIKMALLASKKNKKYKLNTSNPDEQGFINSLQEIWFQVAVSVGVNPFEFRDSLDEQ